MKDLQRRTEPLCVFDRVEICNICLWTGVRVLSYFNELSGDNLVKSIGTITLFI